MSHTLPFFLLAIFALFLGSQLTEAALLVPYWKTLSGADFYNYYTAFGPFIGRYYTILTITAALIPVGVSMYCAFHRSRALTYAIVSTFFTLLVIALFYFYFKETNHQFAEAPLSTEQLHAELITWGNWHWLRVLFETVALIFLILAFSTLDRGTQKLNTIRSA